MKIVVLASEGAPYAKSGGLGDVMQALPAALSALDGNEITLILPYYKKIKENPAYKVARVAHFRVALGWRQQYAGVMKLQNSANGVQVYFIDNLYYFGDRDGAIYGHGDDAERFAYFSKACLDALVALELNPDIIACNDWQTALVPTMLRTQYRPLFPKTKCLFTIHNIEYQGWADSGFFDDVLALDAQSRERLDMNGSLNFMKAAIETADMVSTVSQSYAKELMYPYYAHGLQSVIAGNAEKFVGITNGIDIKVFDPETDPALVQNYNADTFLSGKAACKAALQKQVGLPVEAYVPLMVMVTRLAGHKGLDLLRHIAHELMTHEDAQLLILGTGEAQFEEFFRALANEFPDKVAAKITFDLTLASRVYAGGDIYLMPSKSEPCGLSQMNAMRYGTVPVVHATGGLKDTVTAADENGLGGLGFTFQSYNADDFLGALQRCLNLYRNNRNAFAALQRTDLLADFSWNKPAKQYMDLFRRML